MDGACLLLGVLLSSPEMLSSQQLSWPARGVACVWLPRLLVRVETLRHPAWDGRPIVLGGGPGQRKVVQYCSPEAEREGIRPGLPLREVASFSRDAIVCQPDPIHAAKVLGTVLERLQKVSPAVEATEEELFLDLRGLHGVYNGDLGRLERAIRAAVPPSLHPRIGIAPGKHIASIAAHLAPAASMRVIPPHETVRFLAPLPVSRLLLPPEIVKRLDLLGLRTVSDLATLPFSAVQAEFGPVGARAWKLAHGQDDAPIVPHQYAKTVVSSLRFEHPLASVDAILAAVNTLLARTFGTTVLRGHSVRQAHLRGVLSDGTSWERLVTFKEAVSSKDVAYDALKSKLQLPQALPTASVDELSLELLGLGGEWAKQPNLFTVHAKHQEEVGEATRQLQARYGQNPLYRAMEVEPWSRVPERRWALIPFEP